MAELHCSFAATYHPEYALSAAVAAGPSEEQVLRTWRVPLQDAVHAVRCRTVNAAGPTSQVSLGQVCTHRTGEGHIRSAQHGDHQMQQGPQLQLYQNYRVQLQHLQDLEGVRQCWPGILSC